MTELNEFRESTRAWLAENCPPGARGPGQIPSGSTKVPIGDPDVKLWLDRMSEKGWTVPMWPKEYGGADLGKDEYMILVQEMRRINARSPLSGMGTIMIGPTLLDHGTEEQKARHLLPIARGEVGWCQGYSEPNAGSDLASLQTRAVLEGDQFVINGQKIWTTGAHYADWMFCLVRTDPDVPKHEGISFMLLPMDQDGVTVRPIKLISGESHFCETFFDNALASRDDLIGQPNHGWTIGKRLLQHERSGVNALVGGSDGSTAPVLAEVAKSYLGEIDGKIGDHTYRERITAYEMNQRAFQLTQKRALDEIREAETPGAATSMFKIYGALLMKEEADLQVDVRGTRGMAWEGDTFSADEKETARTFLYSRAHSIYGGSNEIQLNIIAKRVLALPD